MKIYLLNDTSDKVHAGSDAVMRNLTAKLEPFEIIARHRVGEMSFSGAAIDEADWVIVNGEGTIHHDQAVALVLMESLNAAQERGKKTALINSIYQDMHSRYRSTVRKLDLLTVRDPFSQAQTRELGAEPLLMIDMCVDPDWIDRGASTGKPAICKGRAHWSARVQGRYFRKKTARLLRSLPYPEVPLAGRFEDVVATLKRATLYITGQYHGIYACGLAGTPFVCFPSNSHKIESLLHWSGLPIPICRSVRDLEQQMNRAMENPGIFADFADFLRSQPRHTAAFFRDHIR